MSTGDVADYSDGVSNSSSNTTEFNVAATTAQELLLDPITGGAFNHNDVTQIDIIFDVDNATDKIFFNVVFGSEEFDGDPININHPQMTFLAGTELDGVLDPAGAGSVMEFSTDILAGSTDNKLTFILADSGDSALDSTVYISGLGNVAPPPSTGTVPTPGTLILTGIGLFALRRCRKNLQL